MTSHEERTVRHFLAWIPDDRRRNAPSLSTYLPIAERAFSPTAHVTGQLGLARRIGAGDVIWLVGSRKGLGLPEAALDGRIVVGDVRQETRRRVGRCEEAKVLVFDAGLGSAWFPWKDATEKIYHCQLASSDGLAGLRRDKALGQQLRFTRALSPSSGAALQRLAAEIQGACSLFVSYRWRSSTDIVPRVIPILGANGFVIWWDRWSGPRRLRSEVAPDSDVDRMLQRAIASAKAALVVRSAGYGAEFSWTACELAEIRRQGMPMVEVEDADLRAAADSGRLAALVHQLGATLRRAVRGGRPPWRPTGRVAATSTEPAPPDPTPTPSPPP